MNWTELKWMVLALCLIITTESLHYRRKKSEKFLPRPLCWWGGDTPSHVSLLKHPHHPGPVFCVHDVWYQALRWYTGWLLKHTCVLQKTIFSLDVLYFLGLCPIKICQCSAMAEWWVFYWSSGECGIYAFSGILPSSQNLWGIHCVPEKHPWHFRL